MRLVDVEHTNHGRVTRLKKAAFSIRVLTVGCFAAGGLIAVFLSRPRVMVYLVGPILIFWVAESIVQAFVEAPSSARIRDLNWRKVVRDCWKLRRLRYFYFFLVQLSVLSFNLILAVQHHWPE